MSSDKTHRVKELKEMNICEIRKNGKNLARITSEHEIKVCFRNEHIIVIFGDTTLKYSKNCEVKFIYDSDL